MSIDLENVISHISENKYHFLKNIQNVKGVGLGFKTINGYATNEPCIHVLVQKKLNQSLIVNTKNIIPKTYMGIKTDVLEVGNPRFRKFIEKVRPLQGGYSISLPNTGSGTIGCIVTRLDSNNNKTFYILSNNHVIADCNKTPLGTPIFQPGQFDGGTQSDIIASLSDFIPLNISYTSPYPINYVDAAIAQVKKLSLISTLIASSGKVRGVDEPILNTFVKKSGRTTGLTTGKITTINVTIDVDGGLFKKQILANLKNWYGDSGSLLLNRANKAIGLLYAGEDDKITIACPIKLVLKLLNVKILASRF